MFQLRSQGFRYSSHWGLRQRLVGIKDAVAGLAWFEGVSFFVFIALVAPFGQARGSALFLFRVTMNMGNVINKLAIVLPMPS